MNDQYPYYDDQVECDFCGRDTRGWIKEGAKYVVCGACRRTVKELEQPWSKQHDQ